MCGMLLPTGSQRRGLNHFNRVMRRGWLGHVGSRPQLENFYFLPCVRQRLGHRGWGGGGGPAQPPPGLAPKTRALPNSPQLAGNGA